MKIYSCFQCTPIFFCSIRYSWKSSGKVACTDQCTYTSLFVVPITVQERNLPWTNIALAVLFKLKHKFSKTGKAIMFWNFCKVASFIYVTGYVQNITAIRGELLYFQILYIFWITIDLLNFKSARKLNSTKNVQSPSAQFYRQSTCRHHTIVKIRMNFHFQIFCLYSVFACQLLDTNPNKVMYQVWLSFGVISSCTLQIMLFWL